MQIVTLAEHHYLVAGQELCVAVDEYALAGTHQCAYVTLHGQTHVLDHIAGDAAVLGHEELHDLRIGGGQVLHVLYRCFHQQAVDVAGGYGFLVEHSADLKLLGHADIIHVLDLGNRLAYAKPSCGQACEDVRLAAVGHGYKGVGILYALLFQYGHVAAVGVDDHCVAEFLRQPVAQFAVGLQHLHCFALRQVHHGFLGNLAAAEEDDIVDLPFALAGFLAEHGHVLARAHGVDHVVYLHCVRAARDDRLLAAFDRHYAVVAVGKEPGHELLAYHRCTLADLHYTEVEQTVAQREVVAHPVLLERLAYLLRSQHLGVDQVVQTHLLEEPFVLGHQVLVVVDSRQSFLCAELVGNQTRGHVLRLRRSNGHKQIGVAHTYVLQVAYRCRHTDLRQHVVIGIQTFDSFGTFVHQTDVHVLARQ